MTVSRNRLAGAVVALTSAAAISVLAVSAGAQEVEPVTDLLADADPAQGEELSVQCTACHTFEEGGNHLIGPNLWDVVGRPKASLEDFAYSDALAALEGEWTYDELNEYLANPLGYAPGNRMAFPGVSEPEDRAAVIAYLRSLSPDPAPLP